MQGIVILLRTTYNDYLIQFLNNFNDYILEHGEEFLNDARHYPNDPVTDNVVPLKAHFIDYLEHAPDKWHLTCRFINEMHLDDV